MKKIINGKRYDTDTAHELAQYTHSSRSQFDYYCETLYRKRGGEFFLHGYGHAGSKYAEPAGMSEWMPGERIMPMSYIDAQKWAETHLGVEEYESIFGAVDEDGEKTVLSISITTAQLEQIKRMVAEDAAPNISAWIINKLGL